jgi:hypothetical protein
MKLHLNIANQLMKDQADKHMVDCQFEENNVVFLKLQPYAQNPVSVRSNHKLIFRDFGPYKVIKRLSVVAYELELPQQAPVHPIFHIIHL